MCIIFLYCLFFSLAFVVDKASMYFWSSYLRWVSRCHFCDVIVQVCSIMWPYSSASRSKARLWPVSSINLSSTMTQVLEPNLAEPSGASLDLVRNGRTSASNGHCINYIDCNRTVACWNVFLHQIPFQIERDLDDLIIWNNNLFCEDLPGVGRSDVPLKLFLVQDRSDLTRRRLTQTRKLWSQPARMKRTRCAKQSQHANQPRLCVLEELVTRLDSNGSRTSDFKTR